MGALPLFLLFPLFFFFCLSQPSAQKDAEVLRKKMTEKVLSTAEKGRIIMKTEKEFQRFIVPNLRTYSVFFLWNIFDKKRCPFCGYVSREYTKVTTEYITSLGNGLDNMTVFFVEADIPVLASSFSQVMPIQAAPVIVHLRPGSEKKAREDDLYTFDAESLSAKSIARWINDKAGTKIDVVPWWEKGELQTSAIVVAGVVLAPAIYKSIASFRSRMFWFCASMMVIFSTYMGTVFNAIHNPPFIYTNPQTEETMFFYPSSQQQFVIEGIIIAVCLLGAAISLIVMQYHMTTSKSRIYQYIVFILGMSLTFFLLDIVYWAFLAKYGWYPYKFGLKDLLPAITKYYAKFKKFF